MRQLIQVWQAAPGKDCEVSESKANR